MTKHTDHDTHEHPSLDDPRPGHDLRVARERAGISREFMAESLRLGLEQFDALEHDDYAELPPPAFVRGYFRSYARELGLDPDEYIAAYNRSGVSGRDPDIRTGGGVADSSSSGRGGMIGLLLIALVATGGIGAWWYQQRTVDGGIGFGDADSVEEERTGADDRESETRDSQDPAGGDPDTGDNGAGTEGGGDGMASGEGDREGETDSAAAGDDDAGAAGADTASVDAETAEAAINDADGDAAADAGEADVGSSGDDGEAANDEAQQPTVATPDGEPLESGDDDATGDGTDVADAGDTASGDGAEEDATDDATEDAAATVDDGDDTGADTTASANEPGATSPAATDSPTRAATEAANTGPDEITLEFSSRSWLEVYDDRDRELVYTLYFGSEPITLQGWAPFEIFLGNSPAVEVRFNGEVIDKSAFTRSNNTARFVVDASGVRTP